MFSRKLSSWPVKYWLRPCCRPDNPTAHKPDNVLYFFPKVILCVPVLVCKQAQTHLTPLVLTVTEWVQFLSITFKGRQVGAVFLCFLPNPLSLHRFWKGSWHPDRGSAWKQTAAAAPVTGSDRCAARYRVARWLECRCMADRYHNHTSPLLSLTYWIKHLPSCSWIPHPKIRRGRGFLKGLWDEWSKMRKRAMIPHNEAPRGVFIAGISTQTHRSDGALFQYAKIKQFGDKLQLNCWLKLNFLGSRQPSSKVQFTQKWKFCHLQSICLSLFYKMWFCHTYSSDVKMNVHT